MRIAAGHLIYSNKATLFAVPFDLDKLETRGTAVPILDEVAYAKTTGTFWVVREHVQIPPPITGPGRLR